MQELKEDTDIDEYQVHSSIGKIKLYCLYVCHDLNLEKITTTEKKNIFWVVDTFIDEK